MAYGGVIMAGTWETKRGCVGWWPPGWWPLELHKAGETSAMGQKALKKKSEITGTQQVRDPILRGAASLLSSPHPRKQRFVNMKLFLGLIICINIPGCFFIYSRWATIVSYLPSLVFLSFISIQTISALLARLYIILHSFLLQTQYPPWPRLACFHLPCWVYSFHKLFFWH